MKRSRLESPRGCNSSAFFWFSFPTKRVGNQTPDRNSRKFLLAVIAWSALDPNFGLKTGSPQRNPPQQINPLEAANLRISLKIVLFIFISGSKNWIFGGCSERWPVLSLSSHEFLWWLFVWSQLVVGWALVSAGISTFGYETCAMCKSCKKSSLPKMALWFIEMSFLFHWKPRKPSWWSIKHHQIHPDICIHRGKS